MADIELVVKISEDVYKYAKKYNGSSMLTLRDEEMGMCMNAIANGIPLPKGHGDLKDMEDIYEALEGWDDDTGWIVDAIDSEAPTIIEADKEDKA